VLVEINTSKTNAFIHVHLYSAAPLCTADWYVKHLGARRRDPAPTGDCHVPFAAPSEPLGVIRQPATAVLLDDISLIIYPQQRPGTLVPPRGHVSDHIAVSYPNASDALNRLRGMGVKVLSELQPFHGTPARAAMIEGPDAIAIELVDRPQ
jgi:hypothetical protein